MMKTRLFLLFTFVILAGCTTRPGKISNFDQSYPIEDFSCRIGDSPSVSVELGPSVYPQNEWEVINSLEQAGFSTEKLKQTTQFVKMLDTTSLMVVVGGKVLMDCGNISHISYIASVRKSILAILYGKYVADGTIDLTKTLKDMQMDDVGGLYRRCRSQVM